MNAKPVSNISMIDTPSQQAVAKAATEYQVKDSRGRAITLKKPGALAQYRIVETAGPSASNSTSMSMVLPLIFVTAIDDDPIFLPANKIQLEALISQLGDEGVKAVMQGVGEHFGQVDEEVSKETLKK